MKGMGDLIVQKQFFKQKRQKCIDNCGGVVGIILRFTNIQNQEGKRMKIRNLKRILAWLMCLCMVLSCAAFAEEECDHEGDWEYIAFDSPEVHYEKCADCGMVLGEGEHRFINGMCKYCGWGYVNECTHPNGLSYNYVGRGDTHAVYCEVCH